jgi:hypothetical protein
VTAPKKPRDLGDDLVELRATAARIGKGYGPAYDYAYGLRRSGNGQVKVKTPDTDPTATTYAAGGRTRGLLRRLNSKVQAALERSRPPRLPWTRSTSRGSTYGTFRPATCPWPGGSGEGRPGRPERKRKGRRFRAAPLSVDTLDQPARSRKNPST